MINEVSVLFRIKNLKQNRGRISPEILAYLVDLIEHKTGIGYADPFDLADNTAGHGTYIGSAVSTDFRFIPQTSHGQTDKLPAQGGGHGLAYGSFSRTWRSGKTENRSLADLQSFLLMEDLINCAVQFVELNRF